ncbi:MAG: hypothetical protein Q8R30_01050 [bacterium]|nr:hypothetical protein [bacterium]MDZ4285682.1 hypothetical protein [Candidatus Sungbacteria bacterium]
MNTPERISSRSEVGRELIGKTLIFRDASNQEDSKKETSVTIKKFEDSLGSGNFSDWVKEARVSVSGDNKSREAIFVIKKFSAEQFAEKAVEKFKILKDAGLKTWNTYRINTENGIVLMTNGNSEEKGLLTCNENRSRLAEELSEHKIKSIKNFDSFLQNIFTQAQKADEQGLYIHRDTYGFFIDRHAPETEETDIDFVLADTDNVMKAEDAPQGMKSNYEELSTALDAFLEKYADPALYTGSMKKVEETQTHYLKLMRERVDTKHESTDQPIAKSAHENREEEKIARQIEDQEKIQQLEKRLSTPAQEQEKERHADSSLDKDTLDTPPLKKPNLWHRVRSRLKERFQQ